MFHKALDRVDARDLQAINGWLFDVWILLTVPSVLWWKESLLWIVFMSLYAIVVTHMGGYIAARAEVAAATDTPVAEGVTDA